MMLSGLAIGIVYMAIRGWISHERGETPSEGGGESGLALVMRAAPIAFLVFLFLLVLFL